MEKRKRLNVCITGVAGERIWLELKKIIRGHFADHQLQHMIELGVAKEIGKRDPVSFDGCLAQLNETVYGFSPLTFD